MRDLEGVNTLMAEDLAPEKPTPLPSARPDDDGHDCLDWNSGGACAICRRVLSVKEQNRDDPATVFDGQEPLTVGDVARLYAAPSQTDPAIYREGWTHAIYLNQRLKMRLAALVTQLQREALVYLSAAGMVPRGTPASDEYMLLTTVCKSHADYLAAILEHDDEVDSVDARSST